MANKILVTGGGGFLGKAIATRLVNRGDEVYSFSRGEYADLTTLGIRQIRGSLTDGAAVEAACNGMETVFHVAAKAGVSGSWQDYYDTNVKGTLHILEACKAQGVQRLIYTSSPSVIFDGTDMEGVDESVPYPATYHAPYPETKAMAEQWVIKATSPSTGSSQLKSIILRPHLIWGPGDNHLLPGIRARAKRLKRIGNGENRVDTIYIDNAADAHLLADEALKQKPDLSGNVYFISQDEPIRLWEMVNALLGCAGLPPVKGQISTRVAEGAGWVIETLYQTFGITKEPPMTRFMAKELATAHWFDISRAKRDLGYTPTISTKEGLKRLTDWLKKSDGSVNPS